MEFLRISFMEVLILVNNYDLVFIKELLYREKEKWVNVEKINVLAVRCNEMKRQTKCPPWRENECPVHLKREDQTLSSVSGAAASLCGSDTALKRNQAQHCLHSLHLARRTP